MKVVKRWQDQECPDGFPNIFQFEDGSCVFTSEKRGVWRDASGNLLGEVYKAGFDRPELNEALDEACCMEPLPFNQSDREIWERCIDTFWTDEDN